MSVLSIASRTALEAEREDRKRKMAPFLSQIWDLRNNLPQNTPQIGLLCYTIRSAVRRAVSPIEGLERLPRSSKERTLLLSANLKA